MAIENPWKIVENVPRRGTNVGRFVVPNWPRSIRKEARGDAQRLLIICAMQTENHWTTVAAARDEGAGKKGPKRKKDRGMRGKRETRRGEWRRPERGARRRARGKENVGEREGICMKIQKVSKERFP